MSNPSDPWAQAAKGNNSKSPPKSAKKSAKKSPETSSKTSPKTSETKPSKHSAKQQKSTGSSSPKKKISETGRFSKTRRQTGKANSDSTAPEPKLKGAGNVSGEGAVPAKREIVPLSNPADETVEIKSRPNITGGLIPTAAPDFRSGFISIVGRPNVGKSTLMNYLVGQKIAITSPVAQTTRNRLQGILTTPQAQMIFVDTPGIHKPHHELGKVLVQNARVAINSVDVVLFVVDAQSVAGRGDLFVADLVSKSSSPVILGINKIDQLPEQGRKAAAIKHSYEALAAEHDWTVVPFSALTGDGVESLQQALIEKLSPGPYYYPPDLVTDQPERFIMGELIREQILLHTREEVPHSVAISIDRVEEDEKITRILATVNVERKSQKGIVIGKGGLMMKAISSAARAQMQKLVAGKVYLEIFVRVQERWRQSRTRLSEFGYTVDK